jgi:hypothetical protein
MDELSSLSGHPTGPLTLILSHIIVYFDCEDVAKPQSAVDIQRFFQNSEKLKLVSPLFTDIYMIRKAVQNKFGRTELSKFYNIDFLNFRTAEDLIVTPEYTSNSGFRLRFPCKGVSKANLVREFKGVDDAISVTYSASQRVKAISQHIQNAMTIGDSLKRSAVSSSIDSTPGTEPFEDVLTSATRSAPTPSIVDYDYFRQFSVQEQVKVICTLFDVAQLGAKEKVIKHLIDGQVSNSIIVLHVEQEIEKQMMAYKKQTGVEGLDKSSTYCKADYKKPVGVVTEQITRVKSKCPLLFGVLLKTVCARSFNETYNAAINQKSALDELLKCNRVNKRITTHQEIKKSCFGKRTPSALTKILVECLSTSSIPTTTSSIPAAVSIIPVATSTSIPAISFQELTLQSDGNANERLVTASVEYIKSVASKCTDELTQKEALATSVCEILLQMRDSGHGLTPTGVQLGLLSNLCGFTNQGRTCSLLRE